jgi:hypothetical protein
MRGTENIQKIVPRGRNVKDVPFPMEEGRWIGIAGGPAG